MRNLYILLLFSIASLSYSQDSNSLLNHYKQYYEQMKSQGDVQGVINGLTHLNILQPNEARKDTLSLFYMNDGRFVQALNTIGIESNESDSEIAIQVKATSLDNVGYYKEALVHYEKLFKIRPNPNTAYSLAELKIGLDDLMGATKNITFGIANSNNDFVRTYFDPQSGRNYQVPLRAAFLYLKGLLKFKEDKDNNIDSAIEILDEALVIAPNFVEVIMTKNALNTQRQQASEEN